MPASNQSNLRLNRCLLSTTYLGPIQYYLKLLEYSSEGLFARSISSSSPLASSETKGERVPARGVSPSLREGVGGWASSILFERYEHFEKQTYRNRCCIYGANGKLNLIIPIQHTGDRITIKDVKISYDSDWQKLHWRSIQAAYRSSPYFEYYEDDFAPFFARKYPAHAGLIDFNESLQLQIFEILGMKIKSSHTTSYQEHYTNTKDYRTAMHPKITTYPSLIANPYQQVFEDKHGFISNLSIIDLIFNLGPDAISYLKKLIEKT